MAEHRMPTALRTRVIRGALLMASAVAALGLGVAGPAIAAPKGNANGHLVLTVDGVATALPPGKAVQVATTTCANRGTPVAAPLAVDAVRAAFPAPLVACTGVTLTSKVAAAGA